MWCDVLLVLRAATLTDQHQQLQRLQQQLSAAQREKQELKSMLVALRQHESSHRIAAGEATAKAERLRSELLKCVGELQAQLEMSAAQAKHNNEMLQQLKLAESTAAAARCEAAETRQQLVELATATMAELREDLAGEAVAITGLPSEFNPAQLPMPVASYIKVWGWLSTWHAVIVWWLLHLSSW
jgi:chromosome segregation ATPase